MKQVVNSLYVHKSNLTELYTMKPMSIGPVQDAILFAISKNFKFEVVKYNFKTTEVSLIDAIDWNERYEPIVGNSIIFKADGIIKKKKGGVQVYHMKETFVSPAYKGFNIDDARQRTIHLNLFEEIRRNKSCIGSLKWWTDFLQRNALDTYMTDVIPLF